METLVTVLKRKGGRELFEVEQTVVKIIVFPCGTVRRRRRKGGRELLELEQTVVKRRKGRKELLELEMIVFPELF